jgi:hypothetical protein
MLYKEDELRHSYPVEAAFLKSSRSMPGFSQHDGQGRH